MQPVYAAVKSLSSKDFEKILPRAIEAMEVRADALKCEMYSIASALNDRIGVRLIFSVASNLHLRLSLSHISAQVYFFVLLRWQDFSSVGDRACACTSRFALLSLTPPANSCQTNGLLPQAGRCSEDPLPAAAVERLGLMSWADAIR
jgi:hypothetical protein